jgi:hypothetical protein
MSVPFRHFPDSELLPCGFHSLVFTVWADDVDSRLADTNACFIRAPEGALLLHTLRIPSPTPKDCFRNTRQCVPSMTPRGHFLCAPPFFPSVSAPKSTHSM